MWGRGVINIPETQTVLRSENLLENQIVFSLHQD